MKALSGPDPYSTKRGATACGTSYSRPNISATKRYPMGAGDYVCYAESDDGVNWRFPSQGLIERKGTKDNNIVYGLPQIAETGLHGATVFRDVSAPAEERYKMVYVGNLIPEQSRPTNNKGLRK